jgi:cytochrome b involved in lipid metabolism
MEEDKSEPRLITRAELAKHTTKDDCWILIDGKVYDVTKFDEHPGDFYPLLDNSGLRDASREFELASHTAEAKA